VGLQTIADAIGAFFRYLPNLVAAFLVLLLGLMVASLIIFVVVIMAISQLQVDTEIIRAVVLVVLPGGVIALVLSFGLGTRNVTRNIVAGFYARKLLHIGEEVEIAGEKGVLSGVTPLQILIERDDETLTIPNRVFLDEVVKQ